MKVKTLVAAAALAVMTTGCSSILSDSKYTVAINSNPAGANFEITNKKGQRIQNGVTPHSVTLDASAGFFQGETYTVLLKKKGFQDRTFTLDSSIDGWYLGNVLFGGVLGLLIVDPATGAMFKLPERVDISLDSGEKVASNNKTLTIATLDSLSDADKARLIPVSAK